MTSLVIEQRVLPLNSECCHQVANLHNDNKQMREKKLNKKNDKTYLIALSAAVHERVLSHNDRTVVIKRNLNDKIFK